MTPQELKNSILQLAIQGRLVEQRPEEGTARELYREIQAEKQRLVKDGKIKKEKPLPEIAEDEKPFEIPESWMWVRLGAVYSIIMGQSPDGDAISQCGQGMEFHQGKIFFSETIIGKSTHVTTQVVKVAPPNSVLVCVRAPVGKVNITDRAICIGRGLAAIVPHSQVSTLYTFFLMQTLETAFIRQATGSTFKAISVSIIENQLIPFPPLAEQKRIVAKIEQLQPYIDQYEQAWNRLETFNKRFPDDMRKSILQLAIQGKLVEQRPEEGTGEELYREIQAEKQRLVKAGKIKKEKPLPEIAEDEKPFDIPISWKWCRLSSIGITQTGNTPSKSHPEYTGHDIPFVTPGDIHNDSVCYTNQALSVLGKTVARICSKDSILQVCIGGSIGKAAITEQEVAFNQQINVMTPLSCQCKYIFQVMRSAYFLSTMKAKAGGTATPIINRGLWNLMLIPLPPLAEQKRIVAKLEELLPLCERLK